MHVLSALRRIAARAADATPAQSIRLTSSIGPLDFSNVMRQRQPRNKRDEGERILIQGSA